MRHAAVVTRADSTKKVLMRSLLGVLVLVIAVICALTFAKPAGAAPSYPVTISETTFPDDTFRQYVLDNFSGDGTTLTQTEAEGVTEIYVSRMSNGSSYISSLKGIEYFTNLAVLDCSSNNLSTLDVSNNTALTKLICYSNNLSTLDVSNNIALTYLECSNNNNLTVLDVSNNIALRELNCIGNNLSALDVSSNTALTTLNCSNNSLAALDVNGATALTELICYSNYLTELDVSNNTALTALNCYDNSLKALDVSNNTALTGLNCIYNNLTTLDVSNNTALAWLECHDNSLVALDVSNNTALWYLNCSFNSLTALDVSGAAALVELRCSDNSLTALDVGSSTALVILYCDSNNLAALDVSSNTALMYLGCTGNSLLDLSYALSGDNTPWPGGGSPFMGGSQTCTIAVVPDLSNPGAYLSEDSFAFYPGHSITVDSASYDAGSQRFSTTVLDTDLAFTTAIGTAAVGPDYTLAGTIKFVLAPDTTTPILTAGVGTRTDASTGTATFTSDEAGTYYYAVVESGAAAPTIDTTGAGFAMTAATQSISLAGLSGDTAKDIYIVGKDASGNLSNTVVVMVPAFTPPTDTTAPVLTPDTGLRTSATTGTAAFASDEAGTYYFAVVESGAAVPTIDTSGTGESMAAATQTISITGLLGDTAKDVYIVGKDASGNISNTVVVTIPAFTPPPDTTPPTLTPVLAERTSEADALVGFVSDKAGEYYFALVEHGEAAPSIDTTGSGAALVAGTQSIIFDSLVGNTVKDVYIVGKDAFGNISDTLLITIPALALPAPPLFTIGSGEHTVGEDASITLSTERSMNADGFTGLLVDGDGSAFGDLVRTSATTFEGANATVTEGSTVVVLKAAYLDTLSVGTHSITLLYSDGIDVTGTFAVMAAAGTGTPGTVPDPGDTPASTLPATGDNPTAALVTLGVLAALAGAGLLLRRRVTAR